MYWFRINVLHRLVWISGHSGEVGHHACMELHCAADMKNDGRLLQMRRFSTFVPNGFPSAGAIMAAPLRVSYPSSFASFLLISD